MNAKLKARLEELEEGALELQTLRENAVRQAAYRALSDDDLHTIISVVKRWETIKPNTVAAAYADCSPEERSAFERLDAASRVAAKDLSGRPLTEYEENLSPSRRKAKSKWPI